MTKVKMEPIRDRMPILCVCPVVLVGAMVNDKPDFVTVAWTGVAASFPPSISIALQP